MESIISVFFGVCFPHATERVINSEDVEEFYMIVHEPLKGRNFMKVVGDIKVLEKAIKTYDISWDVDSFLSNKQPLMVSASGSMVQKEIGQSFLGTTLEEKFHVNCSSLTILPCLPLIPEILRNKVHVDVSPSIFQESVKAGYFLVNLSLNQAFGAPEFNEIHSEDENQNDDGYDDNFSESNQRGHNTLNSDNDEIHSEASVDADADHDENRSFHDNHSDVNEDNHETYNENEEEYEEELYSDYGAYPAEEVSENDAESVTTPVLDSDVEAEYLLPSDNNNNNIENVEKGHNHGGSLGSDLYEAMESTNLHNRSFSRDSFGEGPSSSQHNLDAHISNTRRNINISSYFDKQRNFSPINGNSISTSQDNNIEQDDFSISNNSFIISEEDHNENLIDESLGFSQNISETDTTATQTNIESSSSSSRKSNAKRKGKYKAKDSPKKSKKKGAYGSMEQFVLNLKKK